MHLLFLKHLSSISFRLQQTQCVLECSRIAHLKHFIFYFFQYIILSCKHMYWFFFICGNHASCKTINCSILMLHKKTRNGCSFGAWGWMLQSWVVYGFFLACGGFEISILHQQDLHGWGSITLEKLTFEMKLKQFWLYRYWDLGFSFNHLHLAKINTFKMQWSSKCICSKSQDCQNCLCWKFDNKQKTYTLIIPNGHQTSSYLWKS